MRYNSEFRIGDQTIGIGDPTYFIADIAANHDGDLERAKDLIWASKEAGADCAKFQHFKAESIVSSVGFQKMTGNMSHQASWEKPVDEIYDQFHTRRSWTASLVETCKKADIAFMTTPYDFEAIDAFENIVPAFKVGSGDITFHAAIERMAKAGKPVLLATGASDMSEVIAATELILKHNPNICLMQCNTNYTGSLDNFAAVNLNVLRSFALRWPNMVLGLSDHTPGHTAVIGAVALGARVIEKHFTDDNERVGPDHSFALNPITWRAMVDATRELESAMGDGVKRVEGNEQDTLIIQRRCLRAVGEVASGTVLTQEHLQALRPCPKDAIAPSETTNVLGKILQVAKSDQDEILWTDLA